MKNNEFNERLRYKLPDRIPHDSNLQSNEQMDLISRAFYREFDKYNQKFNSADAQEYLHNLVATILHEYNKYFPNYSIEAHYRFKAPKSLADKIIDYMSRSDRSELVQDKSKQYEYLIDEIKDVFALKLVLIKKPSTFHSKDEKLNNLAKKTVVNQDFITKMQKFESELIEDNFSINPSYKYTVTKKDYYSKCIEVIDQIIANLPQKATELIAHYQNIRASLSESLEIIDTLPEDTLIDEDDYPSGNINFSKLLDEFSSRIYDELDLEILTKQSKSILSDSEKVKNLGIDIESSKEKITPRGYLSNFIILDTLLGPIECQVQPEHAYIDGNTGFSAHTKMKNKKIKGFKIPNPENPEEVKKFKMSVAYVSPKYFTARLDDVEENKVVIQGFTDYKNYRTVVGQVQKGSIQESILLDYFEKIYSLRDSIFDSTGSTLEFIEDDIKKYSHSNSLNNLKKQRARSL